MARRIGARPWEEIDESAIQGRAGLAGRVGVSAGGERRSRPTTTKSASSPGGPHPYFAPWEQAAADAQKDFGIAAVEYKVPTDWKLKLQTELLESLAAQGFKAFGIFPGDPVGVNSTIAELKAQGIPVVALGGCAKDPTDAGFCLATDPFKSTYTMTKALIKAIGRQGQYRPFHRPADRSQHDLRDKAVEKAVAETNGAVKLLQTVADTDSAGCRRSEDQCSPRRAEGSDRRHHRAPPTSRRW